MTTSGSHLLLQSLQRFKLQAGQSDLDVFGNIWDEEAQDELEGQQHMLKKSRGISGVRTEEEAAELNMRGDVHLNHQPKVCSTNQLARFVNIPSTVRLRRLRV